MAPKFFKKLALKFKLNGLKIAFYGLMVYLQDYYYKLIMSLFWIISKLSLNCKTLQVSA